MSDETEELKSPRSMAKVKSAKIQVLLSTFEQQAITPESPHSGIRRARTTLQKQLDQANEELGKQKELYKQTLKEKSALLNQLHQRESEIEDITKARSEDKTKYQKVFEKNKLLKSQNNELKAKLESLRLQLKEKNPNEGYTGTKTDINEVEPQNTDIMLKETILDDINSEEKKEDSISQCEDVEEEKLPSTVANELVQELKTLKVRNRDSLKIIEEYDEMNRKQHYELQQSKHQLLSVLTLAERLEQELNEEKEAHRMTKERFEKLKYTRSDPSKGEKRSQSYTSSEVNSYVTNSTIEIPSLDIPSQPISPGMHSKKKKRTFMRKFGKSQSKMEYASTENVTQPSFPVLPSPRQEKKREVVAGPNSKQELRDIEASSSPVGMSEDQMQRELEVLLLLGETLQTELANEKKAHINTKKQLQEIQAKLDDPEQRTSNGITNMIRRSKTISSDTNIVTDHLQQELEEIERGQYYNVDDVSLQCSRVDIYDLTNTVTEMLAFTDYLIHSASNPP